MNTRYAITHVNADNGLRRLTFAQQARDTYETLDTALAALIAFRGPHGLPRVLKPEEVATLRVDAVECYDHGDPVRYYL